MGGSDLFPPFLVFLTEMEEGNVGESRGRMWHKRARDQTLVIDLPKLVVVADTF